MFKFKPQLQIFLAAAAASVNFAVLGVEDSSIRGCSADSPGEDVEAQLVNKLFSNYIHIAAVQRKK